MTVQHLTLFQRDRDYHEIRVLLLVNAVAHAHPTPGHVDGLTQLAKLDFLLRYPGLANRALEELRTDDPRLHLSAPDAQNPEAPMRRHRYGPWDERYYTVVGALISRRLLRPGDEGRSRVTLAPTPAGASVNERARATPPWRRVADRCSVIAEAAGHLSGNRLSLLIRAHLPQIDTRHFGKVIR